jgi:hypothetical protein
MSITAAVSLLLLPFAAIDSSQSPVEPEPADRARIESLRPSTVASGGPRWSIGVGVAFFDVLTMYKEAFLSDWSLFGKVASPTVATSLERALSDRTWLAVDLSAAFERVNSDSSSSAGHQPQNRHRRLSMEFGVRHILNRPGAPVDVSVMALAGGWVEDFLRDSSTSLTQWSAGVSGGIAIDRQLVPGLTVRVASPVIAASYLSIKGTYATRGKGFSTALQLAPRLELRLSF